MKELRSLRTDPPEDIILYPKNDDNLFRWSGCIKGPPDTPYEGGHFHLDIVIPDRYPLQPPTMTFTTKVFHPNVHWMSGEICLDLLKDAWSAVFTLETVCRSIIALLAHPEPDSPLNCDSGNLLRCGDERGYHSLTKLYTHLFASTQPKHAYGKASK
eukprot:CAMPEP_0177675648 /NCGR_PEP_ID=MMETSP0447-20121125/27321_1 /TAXON_ID=0 /ORGANISM="Stygamoeba regulata, Strain BSH-02190019" /LENGTH=156 /DNA_ID=CAMNT_0019184065 /DNA_START=82 /DNA_END=552 /DNA_ORIENTATION=+